MNRIMLYAAVLFLAVRQRWFMSKWNPWGAASGRHGSTLRAVKAMEAGAGGLLRAAQAGTPRPPAPED